MSFKKTIDALFELKRQFPDMTFSPTAEQWGRSVVHINLPVDRETAELLIQAQQMFEPKVDNWMEHHEPDEPPF